jgi:hypothetical protein
MAHKLSTDRLSATDFDREQGNTYFNKVADTTNTFRDELDRAGFAASDYDSFPEGHRRPDPRAHRGQDPERELEAARGLCFGVEIIARRNKFLRASSQEGSAKRSPPFANAWASVASGGCNPRRRQFCRIDCGAMLSLRNVAGFSIPAAAIDVP